MSLKYDRGYLHIIQNNLRIYLSFFPKINVEYTLNDLPSYRTSQLIPNYLSLSDIVRNM